MTARIGYLVSHPIQYLAPLFRELARQADRAPRWNFHKYLVDRQGKVVEDYSSLTGPTDAKLVAAVEKALGAR